MAHELILAVDDEAHILELLSFNLENEGYRVMTAANGEDALTGVMLESNLLPGSQKIQAGCRPDPGISITDSCIGWDETAELIRRTHEALGKIHGENSGE